MVNRGEILFPHIPRNHPDGDYNLVAVREYNLETVLHAVPSENHLAVVDLTQLYLNVLLLSCFLVPLSVPLHRSYFIQLKTLCFLKGTANLLFLAHLSAVVALYYQAKEGLFQEVLSQSDLSPSVRCSSFFQA